MDTIGSVQLNVPAVLHSQILKLKEIQPTPISTTGLPISYYAAHTHTHIHVRTHTHIHTFSAVC